MKNHSGALLPVTRPHRTKWHIRPPYSVSTRCLVDSFGPYLIPRSPSASLSLLLSVRLHVVFDLPRFLIPSGVHVMAVRKSLLVYSGPLLIRIFIPTWIQSKPCFDNASACQPQLQPPSALLARRVDKATERLSALVLMHACRNIPKTGWTISEFFWVPSNFKYVCSQCA